MKRNWMKLYNKEGVVLRVHQLVAKIPRSRRWRASLHGRRVMAAAVKLREVSYRSPYADAA